jgi:hypothetical protein
VVMSLTERAVLPFAKALGLDVGVPGAEAARVNDRSRSRSAAQQRSLSLRPLVHAVLADADGAWAWSPDDPHAAATRHASVQSWIEEHPGRQLRLWVSGSLVRSLERGSGCDHADDVALRAYARRAFVERHGDDAGLWALATWRNNAALGVCALAGIDLGMLSQHARRHDVRMQSVVPWWYHAFQEARRCVHALNHAAHGLVGVVEGRQLVWIATTKGQLSEVWQTSLEAACVEALRAELGRTAASHMASKTVVLGQGLVDGARCAGLDAWVLGRLDGEQPPQWLRPSLRDEMH